MAPTSNHKLSSDQTTPSRFFIAEQNLESDKSFPSLTGSLGNPETTYLSSYFQDGYHFPWNPDTYARGNSYKIYDEMKDDDQVKSALSFKKDMVVNSGWRIVCENEEVKEFITNCLENNLDLDETGKSFDDILRDLLSSYEYGFSIAEPVFSLNKENLYEYKSIRVRPPHSFRFDVDRFGTVLKIIQSTDKGEISLDPKKFIHHVYQPEFGSPYGKSDLKSAYSSWKAKKFFMRFYAMYVERFAGPMIKGTYKSGLDSHEVQRIHNVLKSMQNSTVLALPDDVSVDFIESKKDSASAYIDGLKMFNLWIARAVLVPDLMGMSGEQTSGGSYSLGQTQFKMFINTIQKDRKSLARKITLKLIKPLVETNFGDCDAKFEFLPIAESDEIEYSKVWSDFIKSRIVKPSEEELNHFRRSLKFPEVVGEQMPVEIESGDEDPKEDGMDDMEDPMPEDKPQDIPDEPSEQKDLTDNSKSVKYFRALNQYEKTVDFKSIENSLDMAESKIIPVLERAGKVIIRDYVEQFITKGIVRNFKPEKLDDLKPRFIKDMNVVFKNYFIDLFKQNYTTARAEIFSNAPKKFIDAEILPEEFLAIVQAESFRNVGDYVTEITKKAKNKIFNGIKQGLPEDRIASSIEEEMEDASKKWLQTVIRTKTTEMFNAARKTYWETDPIASQLVEAYEFSAILDDRTSDVCRELDGKIFDKGDYIDKITPPLHFNCRSILVPVTKFQDYEISSDVNVEKLKSLGANLLFTQEKETK